ncbi:hydroxysteroid dehydrogenase-like protein 1 [Trichonephila clavipes]|nr:hydroxysteroid dehydrogenase-like protein 1 [Trichonephila clavipes]
MSISGLNTYLPKQDLKLNILSCLSSRDLQTFLQVSDVRLPVFRPTISPGHLRYASAKLDLVLPVHKHKSLLAELRSVALATIHERYPDQDWLHVCTDVSATASFGRAGAGALSDSFNLQEHLSAWSGNFDGEIQAIFMASRAISTTPGLNIVIFIDSQAAIKTVSISISSCTGANNLSTHFFAPEERSYSNGSHIIAAFMEMSKPTSLPNYLQAHLFNIGLLIPRSALSVNPCQRLGSIFPIALLYFMLSRKTTVDFSPSC